MRRRASHAGPAGRNRWRAARCDVGVAAPGRSETFARRRRSGKQETNEKARTDGRIDPSVGLVGEKRGGAFTDGIDGPGGETDDRRRRGRTRTSRPVRNVSSSSPAAAAAGARAPRDQTGRSMDDDPRRNDGPVGRARRRVRAQALQESGGGFFWFFHEIAKKPFSRRTKSNFTGQIDTAVTRFAGYESDDGKRSRLFARI